MSLDTIDEGSMVRKNSLLCPFRTWKCGQDWEISKINVGLPLLCERRRLVEMKAIWLPFFRFWDAEFNEDRCSSSCLFTLLHCTTIIWPFPLFIWRWLHPISTISFQIPAIIALFQFLEKRRPNNCLQHFAWKSLFCLIVYSFIINYRKQIYHSQVRDSTFLGIAGHFLCTPDPLQLTWVWEFMRSYYVSKILSF